MGFPDRTQSLDQAGVTAWDACAPPWWEGLGTRGCPAWIGLSGCPDLPAVDEKRGFPASPHIVWPAASDKAIVSRLCRRYRRRRAGHGCSAMIPGHPPLLGQPSWLTYAGLSSACGSGRPGQEALCSTLDAHRRRAVEQCTAALPAEAMGALYARFFILQKTRRRTGQDFLQATGFTGEARNAESPNCWTSPADPRQLELIPSAGAVISPSAHPRCGPEFSGDFEEGRTAGRRP